MFEIKKETENIIVAKPHFNIDMENLENVFKFKDSLLKIIDETDNPILILNLEECEFIDSTGLGNIIRIFENIRRKNGKFLACYVNENILDLFDITTVNKYIECHLTLEDALNSVK